MAEQLGTGKEAQVVTLGAKPTIANLPTTATTADLEAIGNAINETLTALSNLGLITVS
jgi:hypothetical protein